MATPLSQSELQSFDLCKLNWRFKYEDRLLPKKRSIHLDFGSTVHAGLENFYRGGSAKDGAESYVKETVVAQAEENGIELDESYLLTLESASVYLDYYSKLYASDRDWDVLGVERYFSLCHPLDPSIVLEGKLDLIANISSRFFVGEHKTASAFDSDINKLELDFQISCYAWAVSRLLGLQSVTFLYNVIRKPTIKQRQDESGDEYLERLSLDISYRPEKYFQRVWITRTENNIKRIGEEIYYKALDVRRVQENPFTITRTPGDHCIWKCAYRQICIENTRSMQEAMYNKGETRHSELV